MGTQFESEDSFITTLRDLLNDLIIDVEKVIKEKEGVEETTLSDHEREDLLDEYIGYIVGRWVG